MADYVSIYTGAQLDNMIMSGSSVSGKIIDNTLISGSILSTGSFAYLNVVGDAVIGGNLTIGDADTDSVSISADLTSNLIPNATNTFDLGTLAKSWNRLNINSITASGNISGSFLSTGSFGRLELAGNANLVDITAATGSLDSINLSASGSALTFKGNISGSLISTGSFGKIETSTISGVESNIHGHVFNNDFGHTRYQPASTFHIEVQSGNPSTIGPDGGGDDNVNLIQFRDNRVLIGDHTYETRINADSSFTLGLSGSMTVMGGDIVLSGSSNISGSSLSTGSFGRLELAGNANLVDITAATGSLDSINLSASGSALNFIGHLSGSSLSTGSFGHVIVEGSASIEGDISASGQLIAASADFKDGNITNVGLIDVDSIRADAASNVVIQMGTSGFTFNAEASDLFDFNSTAENTDFRVRGEGEDNVIYVDASADKLGIGTNVPSKLLTVAGDISASGQYFNLSGSDHSSLQTLSVGQSTAATDMELTVVGDISASGDFFIRNTSAFVQLKSTGNGNADTYIEYIGGAGLTNYVAGTNNLLDGGVYVIASGSYSTTKFDTPIAQFSGSGGGNKVTITGDIDISSNITGSIASTGSFARVENVDKLILTTQTIAAAGDAQGNATAVDANGGSTVFVTGADSAKGVVLPVVANLTIGQTFTIHNTVSGQTLKVYPGSGDKILPAADNTAITIAANTCVVVTHFSADGFVGYEPAVIVSD